MSDLDPDALRRARLSAGLTQRDLAAAVLRGYPGRVSQWENGLSQPFPRQLARIAEVLGVGVADLLLPVERKTLRRLRIEAALTIGEVATAIHATEPTVRRWEHGRVVDVVQRAPIERLAAVLHVSESEVEAALEESLSRP